MSIKFLACDLETTGLIPSQGVILEAACIPLDENLEQCRDAFNGTFGFDGDHNALSEFIKKMHGPKGTNLLFTKATHTLGEFEDYLIGTCTRDVHLLGSTVYFDKAWLNHHVPDAQFSHQVMDSSSLKLLYPIEFPDEPESDHRAANDIAYSIRVAKAYRKMLKLALG